MEIFFEFFAEFLLQIFSEVIVELGFRGLVDTFSPKRHPVLSTIGFGIWGIIAGAISLWPFPHSFVANPALRWLNLAVTPLICAVTMRAIAKQVERRNARLLGQGRFAYALTFAAMMALVRFVFTK